MIDIVKAPSEIAATSTCRAAAPKPVQSRYTYRDGEHELDLSIARPSRRQVEAVAAGECEFALIAEEPLILLGARFGEAIPWTFSSYCWHLLPRDARTLPPATHSPHEARALLHIRLLDRDSGLVRDERNVTLWLHFTRALHEAIREQAGIPLDPRGQDRALTRLLRRYPTDDALAGASRIRTIGSL